MEDTTSTLLVPAFFGHATIATAILAWWFLKQKDKSLKKFGWGMAGYALGLAAWTAVVVVKPDNIKPLILVGVVPFLLAHVAYAKAAGGSSKSRSSTLAMVVGALIFATFLARTFFYPSEPYFSDKGLLFFGLTSVTTALYIATISASFLPAIRTVSGLIKDKALKSVMGVGLTVLYVNSIVLVSAKDDTLLLINGVVLTAALLVLWVKVLATK